MSDRYLVILNPAAGGGRCAKLAGPGIARLRDAGLKIDVQETHGPGDASKLARQAYSEGRRNFIAIGGDGTTFEIVNGLFPISLESGEKPRIGLLPLGTGNSFLRDFSNEGLEYAVWALTHDKRRPCDVMRLTHRDGALYYINILSMGFVADVCTARNRRFHRLGEAGYVVGVFAEVAKLRQNPLNMTIDEVTVDRDPVTFVSFNNSRFTGGKMMMAPYANPEDGKIDFVRVGAMNRRSLLRTFPKIFKGTHLNHPAITSRKVNQVDFDLDHPVDVMIDGEVLSVIPKRLDVLHGALEMMV